MKEILIIVGSYFPKPDANGICAHQVALGLKDLGYCVHVICLKKKGDQEEDVFEGIHTHRIEGDLLFKLLFYSEDNRVTWKGRLAYRAAMIISKIKKLVLMPWFPMRSVLLTYRYFRKAELLNNEYEFDLVLAVHKQLETAVAGAMLKKKYETVKFGLYDLDSISNSAKSRYLPESWQTYKGYKWEQMIYSYADVIYNLKCHEKHYRQERYDRFTNKMVFVDIPLFRPLSTDLVNGETCFDTRYVHWVYTGSLSMNFRDPFYACEVFSLLIGEHDEYRFHFYSRGNCEERLMEYEDRTSHAIVRHGYVEVEEAVLAITSADVLVSFGASKSTMIPSKIFEYMATGKPIIHFYVQDDDVCIPYYKEYPLVLMIKQDKDLLEENAKKIELFIENSKNKRVNFDEIEERFVMNMPEYTACMIDSILH